MSQPSGDSPTTAGAEEPPPLETVEVNTVVPMSHLAESVPLRRAPEAEAIARLSGLLLLFCFC